MWEAVVLHAVDGAVIAYVLGRLIDMVTAMGVRG